MSTTRVMLVDDQCLFRRGVRATLEARPEVEIVGETQNDDGAIEAVVAARPDVVVLGELGGGWDVFAAALRGHAPPQRAGGAPRPRGRGGPLLRPQGRRLRLPPAHRGAATPWRRSWPRPPGGSASST